MRHSLLALSTTCMTFLTLAAACGPSELPAFADPPPDDAAVHAKHEAAIDDSDAGEHDAHK